MVEPIKISTKSSALTCDEYDQNLDILRDRANHVGTQSCNTLNDLDSCLATSDTVDTLNTSINQNTTRIINLENTLSASGSIANDLNSLEAVLTADINQNRASITALETEIDDLEIRVSGTESNLVSLTNVVTLNNTTAISNLNAVINTNNSQNTRLTNVENRATTLNSNILTEAATRQSAVNNLQSEIDAEETNRINAITNVITSLDNEESARITADNTITNNISTLSINLNNKITTEKNERILGDANLQSQLNSLTNSISNAIPSGALLPFVGNFNVIPTGFLLCSGAAVSRTTYATLFSRIGTRYGVGNGTTTFNIPDFRDKIMYGSFNGNLDTTPTQLGSNSVTLSVANLASHNHTIITDPHTHDVDIQHDHDLFIHAHTHTTGPTGSHNHSLSPFRLVALGGGGEDDSGGEITNVPSSSVNNYPITTSTSAAGPVVNATSINIYNPPWQGTNKTNALTAQGAARTTQNSGALYTSTITKGDNVPFDVRQDSLRVNYIIKT
jgi:microcystin-dependent protein